MLARSEIEAIAVESGLERVASEIAEAALPAARLEYDPVGRSRLGGLPHLPAKVAWPVWRGRPLSALAQVALHDVPDEVRAQGLPATGVLTFFWDSGAVGLWSVAGGEEVPDAAGWGFDPADAGSAAVVYSETDEAVSRSAPDALPAAAILPERRAAMVPEATIPSYGSRAYDALELEEGEVDAYLDRFYPRIIELAGVRGSPTIDFAPRHQLLGHADVIQGDMQLEAQLVTNGLYCGDSTGYQDARAQELERGADEWRLLFQLGSDEDELGVMWGDVGRLYFWIRDADLRAARFDAIWLILQCA